MSATLRGAPPFFYPEPARQTSAPPPMTKEALPKRRFTRRLASAALAVACAAQIAACAPERTARSWFALGTVCGLKLYEKTSERTVAAVVGRVAEIERVFSPHIAGSDADLLRKNAGVSPVAVRPEFLAVLRRALYFAELSGGAFDPAIGPLVRLWDIGGGNERVPAAPEIEAARALVDRRLIALDEERGTAFLPVAGMSVDLGAIAKGYAADEAARVLREAGVRRAIIDFGGDIVVMGAKREAGRGPGRLRPEVPWKIGIQDPFAGRGANAAVVRCSGAALVTSGVYERFFEADGARYHHILSTADGYPVNNGLASVTVVAGLSSGPFAATDADGLSTALFALGYEAGTALLETLPDYGAVFIFKTGEIRATANLAGSLDIADLP